MSENSGMHVLLEALEAELDQQRAAVDAAVKDAKTYEEMATAQRSAIIYLLARIDARLTATQLNKVRNIT